MSDYYQRGNVVHLDGTRVFHNQEDVAAEDRVAAELQARWRCTMHRFGALCAIDWYARRDERMVGLLEVKCRPHASDHYPTVFLNVRKWFALTLGSNGLGVPAIFVVRFTDALMWTRVADIDAWRHRIGGCSRIVKARSDIEPVIDVPVSILQELREAS